MVKNPPSNAGHKGSTLDRGTQIPHAEGQLSHSQRNPRAAMSTLTATKTQHSPPKKCLSTMELSNSHSQFLVGLFFFLIFIYFWLHWVFFAARGLSLVAVSGGYSSLRCSGFSLRWLLLLRSTGSRWEASVVAALWAQQLWLAGSGAQAQQLRCTRLVAPRHVGSSRTRARTRVPCIGRRILNHCTTREALLVGLLFREF